MRTVSRTALALILTLYFCLLAYGQSAAEYEDIFQKVFGYNPNTQLEEVDVYLSLDDHNLGAISAQLTRTGSVLRLERTRLREYLRSSLEPTFVTELLQSVTENYVTREYLEKHDMRVIFTPPHLKVAIYSQPLQRQVTVLRVNQYALNGASNALRNETPAQFSGYYNFNWHQDWQREEGKSDNGTSLLDIESVINIRGWHLIKELSGGYDGQEVLRWRELYLEHNNLDQQVAIRFGAINYPTLTWQSAPDLLGYSYAKLSQLAVDPVPQQEPVTINLTDSAEVIIKINEIQVKKYQLLPGKYRLENFPLSIGFNRIIITIAKENGPQKQLTRGFFYDPRLNLAGGDEYHLGGGYIVDKQADKWVLDNNTKQIAGFYRRTWANNFLAGAFFEAQNDSYIIGAESAYGTPWALWTPFYVAAWEADRFQGQTHGLVVSNYNDIYLKHARLVDWQLDYTNTTAGFRTLQQTTVNQTDLITVGLQSTLALSPQIALSGRLAKSFYALTRDVTTLTFTLSSRAFLPCRLSYQWQGDAQRTTDRLLLFTAWWHLPLTNSNIRYQRDLYLPQDRVDMSHDLELVHNDNFDFSVNINRDNQYAVQTSYTLGDNRFEAFLTPDYFRQYNRIRTRRAWLDTYYSEYHRSLNKQNAKTGFQLSSALVFADGHWAISRPINKNFAIVYPHPSWATTNVNFSNTKAGIDLFGPAVITDMAPYRQNTYLLEVDNLSALINPGQRLYKFAPQKYTGYVVQAGTDQGIIAWGTIVDEADQPVTLKVCRLIDRYNPDKIYTFFLNRAGRFQIGGIEPGVYNLTVADYPQRAEIVVTIPAVTHGVYNMGFIPIAKPQRANQIITTVPAYEPQIVTVNAYGDI